MHRNDEPPLPLPKVRFRGAQFERHCRQRGLTTATLQAEYTRLSRWTLSRLFNGQHAPGEQVIACILDAFPELDFDDFFEVVSPARRIARPAKKKVAA